jgi:hypothetical protein
MGKFECKKARVRARGSASQIPPLYPLLRRLGKETRAVHGVRTPPPPAVYTNNDRGSGPACQSTWVNQLVKQREKVRRLTGVTHCAQQSHHFGNYGSNCLSTHDACCTITDRPLPPWNHRRDASSAMPCTMTRCVNQALPRVQ